MLFRSVDPGVTSRYAIRAGSNNQIEIGAVVGAITTTEYVAGLGVLNATGNINGLFANTNVAIIGAGNQGWLFDSTGNLTTPGAIITGTGTGGNINGVNYVSANYFSGLWTSTDGIGNTAQVGLDIYGDLVFTANAGATEIGGVHVGHNSNNISLISANGNIGLSANTTGANVSWSFNTTGNLTLPNGAVIKDTVTAAVAFGDGAGARDRKSTRLNSSH